MCTLDDCFGYRQAPFRGRSCRDCICRRPPETGSRFRHPWQGRRSAGSCCATGRCPAPSSAHASIRDRGELTSRADAVPPRVHRPVTAQDRRRPAWQLHGHAGNGPPSQDGRAELLRPGGLHSHAGYSPPRQAGGRTAHHGPAICRTTPSTARRCEWVAGLGTTAGELPDHPERRPPLRMGGRGSAPWPGVCMGHAGCGPSRLMDGRAGMPQPGACMGHARRGPSRLVNGRTGMPQPGACMGHARRGPSRLMDGRAGMPRPGASMGHAGSGPSRQVAGLGLLWLGSAWLAWIRPVTTDAVRRGWQAARTEDMR